GSFPVVIAGWILRIPIFLHESDADAGLSNLLLSKFAKKILISFPKTERLPLSKTILVGNPIRKEILQGTSKKAQEIFKLTGEKPVVLILGGSQGAQPINDMILAILPKLVENYEVLHQIGEKNFVKYLPEVDITIPKGMEKYYHPVAFFREQELKHVLAAADLVVARAGSGTLFEIAAVGKPLIIMPLPDSAQGHQLKNAYAYAASGAAIVLEQNNTTPNFFLEKLKYLFSHPNELEKMRQATSNFSKPEAGKNIARIIFNSLKM
ncbi:glycosyltransferase, partial [Patescibacteria group bacterium]|nr:glycosyltransferase [Patescibacteria group bacterium]